MPCKRHRTCPCLLQATPGHPFYILNDDETRSHDEFGHSWIRAKDLKAGDIILLLDGARAIIESVESEQLDKPVKVYNFEVEDFHTYFVGHGGWSVHNSGCLPSNARSTTNFDEVQRRLSLYHGIDEFTSSNRLHALKELFNIPSSYDLVFDLTGGVYYQNGEQIGTLTQP